MSIIGANSGNHGTSIKWTTNTVRLIVLSVFSFPLSSLAASTPALVHVSCPGKITNSLHCTKLMGNLLSSALLVLLASFTPSLWLSLWIIESPRAPSHPPLLFTTWPGWNQGHVSYLVHPLSDRETSSITYNFHFPIFSIKMPYPSIIMKASSLLWSSVGWKPAGGQRRKVPPNL